MTIEKNLENVAETSNPASASYWESPESVSQGDHRSESWPAPTEAVSSKAGSVTWRILGVIRTIRPHQWVKNIFVLAPVVFAKSVFAPELLSNALSAFFVFCLLAGAVYTLNDIADIAADRVHPVKRFRPIASGRVPVAFARFLVVALVVGSLAWAAFLSPGFALIAATYLTINVAYSLKLKHIAYLDVACIASGFVLRVAGGGEATGIEVSAYLFLCTGLLAFFLGFGKRRHELAVASARAGQQRKALKGYTQKGLDIALTLTAVATTAVYLAYTLDAATRSFFQLETLWPTTLFVVLGVTRFLFIVRNRPRAESPTQEMLSDGPMVAIVLLWIAVVGGLVYHLQPV